MRTFYTAAAGAVLLATAASAHAQDADKDLGWKVSAELGAISTSGNTEATSFNGSLEATQLLENWENKYVVNAYYKEDEQQNDDGTSETVTSAEQYFGSAKSSYLFDDDFSSVFVFASHKRDEFGSYRDYTTLAVGYGARLIDRETLSLDAEVGPGYFWGDKVQEDDTLLEEEGFVARAAAELEWLISENATFTQKLGVDAAEDNSRYVSDTALTTRINGSLQMKIGYTATHDTEVADDKESTDTKTYINLVYSF